MISQSGSILNYDGDIDDKFLSILREHTFDTLVINSPGGNLYQGLQSGKWLRENQKNVHVAKECSSACVYVLSGGVSRTATDEAKIGVHRFYAKPGVFSSTPVQDTQITDAAIVSFFQLMGISAELFVVMQKVPSEEMQYLDHNKLLEWKLLSPEAAQLDGYGFARVAGQDALGNDIGKIGIPVKDLDSCAQACSKNSECVAFTFNTVNNFCFLKDRVDIVVYDSRAVMGYKKTKDFAPKTPISVSLKARTKLWGKSYENQETVTSSECMLLCLKDDKCEGYNYETKKSVFTTRKICSLLSSIEGASADYNVSSGQRSSATAISSGLLRRSGARRRGGGPRVPRSGEARAWEF